MDKIDPYNNVFYMIRPKDVILTKMMDAWETPGFQATFDPDEADRAGFFIENALNEEDAFNSIVDLAEAI